MTKAWLPDPDDRHVLAAAIQAEARVIVTANVKDFPRGYLAEHAIRAITPADFLTGLIRGFPQLLLEILHEQAAAMRRSPMTYDALVAKLAKHAPTLGAILREVVAGEGQAPDYRDEETS